jgi:hypothetical protein
MLSVFTITPPVHNINLWKVSSKQYVCNQHMFRPAYHDNIHKAAYRRVVGLRLLDMYDNVTMVFTLNMMGGASYTLYLHGTLCALRRVLKTWFTFSPPM